MLFSHQDKSSYLRDTTLAATEEETNRLPDDELLRLAGSEGRVLFTHDIRRKALAEQWQRDGQPFSRLLYGHDEGASIGRYVRDLELIAQVCVGQYRSSFAALPKTPTDLFPSRFARKLPA